MSVTTLDLTCSGWFESEHFPKGVVEIWEREAQRREGGGWTIDYSLQWANPGWSSEKRKALRDSFPRPEVGVYARIADVCWEIPD